MTLDVCVVTYRNTADSARRALRAQDQLFVHDNTDENLGFAAAANRAAAKGNDDVIAFVNPDGVPTSGCFDRLQAELVDPCVVAVAASQGPRWDPSFGGGHIEWLSAACLAVRRDAFEQVGGFDERLFMYCEDVDLSYKLAQLGELRRCPDAVFHHDPGPRSYRAMHRNFRNWLVVQRRHRKARPGRMLRDAIFAARTGRFRDAVSRVTGVADYALRGRRWA